MTPEQFHELAEAGYNRIPVYREVLADLDTPHRVNAIPTPKNFANHLES